MKLLSNHPTQKIHLCFEKPFKSYLRMNVLMYLLPF